MAFYEVSVLTTITTASVPIAALRGITRPLKLYEFGMSAITAPTTSGGFGLARSTALGTGGLTGVVGLACDPGNSTATGTGELITAWATLAPTFTAGAFLRRWAFPASIGAALIWSWPPGREPIIPGSAAANSELVLVNLQATAAGTWEIYCAWEE